MNFEKKVEKYNAKLQQIGSAAGGPKLDFSKLAYSYLDRAEHIHTQEQLNQLIRDINVMLINPFITFSYGPCLNCSIIPQLLRTYAYTVGAADLRQKYNQIIIAFLNRASAFPNYQQYLQASIRDALTYNDPTIFLYFTNGGTALHAAVLANDATQVYTFLKNGINKTAVNSAGQTPLNLATTIPGISPEILRLLQ